MADNDLKVKYDFVGMMFAVAVGAIGIKFADLIQLGLEPHECLKVAPAWMQLLLATVLIATSWVGWTRTRSPGGVNDVHDVFSWAFVVLLIDVILVIMYFVIVNSAEVVKKEGGIIQIYPSARRENFWMMCIFAGYLVWDIVTKCFIARPEDTRTLLKRFLADKYWPRILISFITFIIALGMWETLYASSTMVVAADWAWIALLFLFRGLKQLASAYPVNSNTITTPEKKMLAWWASGISLAALIISWSIAC